MTWVRCGGCDDWYCTLHKTHTADCECPEIQDQDEDPYGGDVMTPNDLIATRVKLGLSQAELARLLDVPASTVSRWERGLNRIASPRILARALRDLEREKAFTPAEKETDPCAT